MNRILILFAHPLFEKSKIHQSLIKSIPNSDFITFHDLYEVYPEFNIRIKKEQELLVGHDIIIWQHPFYWYSVPPLMKQWMDLALEFGWAYGPGGEALKGKIIFNILSTGGREEAYSPEGRNRYTIHQFLAPVEQTVRLCHMHYLPPFVIHGTHLLSPAEINKYSHQYNSLLEHLQNSSIDSIKSFKGKYLNEIVI